MSKTGSTGTLTQTSIAVVGSTVIGAAIETLNIDRIYIEIDNEDSTNDLDGFVIDVSADGSAFQTLYAAASDYASPKGVLVGVSGDLTALVASTTGWLRLDCSAFKQVRLSASADTGAINVSGRWSAL